MENARQTSMSVLVLPWRPSRRVGQKDPRISLPYSDLRGFWNQTVAHSRAPGRLLAPHFFANTNCRRNSLLDVLVLPLRDVHEARRPLYVANVFHTGDYSLQLVAVCWRAALGKS